MDLNLEIDNTQLLSANMEYRQSYVHLNDYSFGSPTEEGDKENISAQAPSISKKMEIEAKFKRKRNLYGEMVNKNKSNCGKKESRNHRQAQNIKSNYNESLLKIRSISSDIMSPKGQLGTAYRQFRKQAIEDLTTLGDSRGFSYTDLQNQSRQSNLSKSISKNSMANTSDFKLTKAQRFDGYK